MGISIIDVTETLAEKLNLYCRRVDGNEIVIQLKNKKLDCHLSVVLEQDQDMIHFTCDLGLDVPPDRLMFAAGAIVRANERIQLGHFDMTSPDYRIAFCLTLPFLSSFAVDEDVIKSCIDIISNECRRFYHYLLMIAGGCELPDACLNALFAEPMGEA
ncbi:MAG: YbjN domain-containing protein [Holosporaceae bacterium]|nr:YbjN domain-containing protein [Holosporaceae bacterium]